MAEVNTEKIVAAHLREGLPLAKIQSLLKSDYGVHMTFMDLRLLAAEIEFDWANLDPKKEEAVEEEGQSSPQPVADEGEMQIEISKIARPGAMVHGSVTFANGNKGEWLVDEYGQLGFELADPSQPPSAEEMQDFQMDLQRMLTA